MKWPATCRPWMAADRPVIQSAWNSSSFSSLIGGELNEEAFLTRESTCGASRWRQIYWQLFKKLRCNNFRWLKHQSISINFKTAALLIFFKNWPNIFLNQQRPNRTRWLIRDLVPTSLFGNKKRKTSPLNWNRTQREAQRPMTGQRNTKIPVARRGGHVTIPGCWCRTCRCLRPEKEVPPFFI